MASSRRVGPPSRVRTAPVATVVACRAGVCAETRESQRPVANMIAGALLVLELKWLGIVPIVPSVSAHAFPVNLVILNSHSWGIEAQLTDKVITLDIDLTCHDHSNGLRCMRFVKKNDPDKFHFCDARK